MSETRLSRTLITSLQDDRIGSVHDSLLICCRLGAPRAVTRTAPTTAACPETKQPGRADDGETHEVDVSGADEDQVLREATSTSIRSDENPMQRFRARVKARRTKGAPASGFLWCVRGPRRFDAMDGRLDAVEERRLIPFMAVQGRYRYC